MKNWKRLWMIAAILIVVCTIWGFHEEILTFISTQVKLACVVWNDVFPFLRGIILAFFFLLLFG